AGPSTVRTAIAKLEAEGWLTRTARRQGNRNASNVYRLNVAKLQAAAFAHLSDSDPSKFEASKSGKNGGFHPSESGGDPSVTSTTDPSDKKPSCPVAPQPDPAVMITDQAKQVLTFLNQKTGSRYQVGKTSLENIRARLGEGFTTEELTLVVEYMTEKWGQDFKMSEYLRPTTLFLPTKFPGYLQAANKWHKAGRPERKNGEWVNNLSPASRAIFKDVDYSLPENSGFRS
ncbi:TPA: conserved phage C-terminal domain-containing protein, partial [Citrobacter sedlakii]|nr:conserved phage C-terminal domain-containing protein [Citrobacter sedlakii]